MVERKVKDIHTPLEKIIMHGWIYFFLFAVAIGVVIFIFLF